MLRTRGVVMSKKRAAEEFDVIVVGAGAAGLAAAAELAGNGLAVCVVDARERAGGRILTVQDANGLPPLEFGAEFIHGESPATLKWLRDSGRAMLDAPQTRWIARRGRLQPADEPFAQMKRSLSRASVPRKDVAFADFLERRSKTIPAAVRALARMTVEGFDAADATRVSAREILEEWGGDSAADAPTFRPLYGYASLVEALSDAVRRNGATSRLGTVVREIKWRAGSVTLHGVRHAEPLRFRAKRAVITVPLGVLKLPVAAPSSIRFEPALSRKEAASRLLGVGPVVKLILHFKRAFWDEIEGAKFRQAAFFHAPGCPFPTFWTTLPFRTTRLIAWAGGPNASRLVDEHPSQVIRLALASLRSIFGSKLDYESELEGVRWHDWQRDPWACGAYSYVKVAGASARKTLGAAVDKTLYFAGEATDTEGESGSVGGALQSGARAARMILDHSS